MGLAKNAVQHADRNLVFPWHDGSIDALAGAPNELYVVTFWLASTKPTDSSRRLTSRKGCGLSRPNLHLDHTDLGRPRSLRRFEMQF